jgi:hypothetical protein
MIRFLAILIWLVMVAALVAVGIGIGKLMLAEEPRSLEIERMKRGK